MQSVNFDTPLSGERLDAFVDSFFSQPMFKPKQRKGRPWTLARMQAVCDTPGSDPVQAVLYPDDNAGFALFARQGEVLHAITSKGRQVRFRTMEQALSVLSDVAHLAPEIVVDASGWHARSWAL